MINQKTGTHEGVTVTVRARIGADVWDEFAIKAKLAKEEREIHEYRTDKFADFVTRTVSAIGLGFAWPSVTSSADDVQAAYAKWCEFAPGFMIFWANLLYDANQPPLPEENVTPGNS